MIFSGQLSGHNCNSPFWLYKSQIGTFYHHFLKKNRKFMKISIKSRKIKIWEKILFLHNTFVGVRPSHDLGQFIYLIFCDFWKRVKTWDFNRPICLQQSNSFLSANYTMTSVFWCFVRFFEKKSINFTVSSSSLGHEVSYRKSCIQPNAVLAN